MSIGDDPKGRFEALANRRQGFQPARRSLADNENIPEDRQKLDSQACAIAKPLNIGREHASAFL
jgi:hypothetical protein